MKTHVVLHPGYACLTDTADRAIVHAISPHRKNGAQGDKCSGGCSRNVVIALLANNRDCRNTSLGLKKEAFPPGLVVSQVTYGPTTLFTRQDAWSVCPGIRKWRRGAVGGEVRLLTVSISADTLELL
jgi:hypothetical protein